MEKTHQFWRHLLSWVGITTILSTMLLTAPLSQETSHAQEGGGELMVYYADVDSADDYKINVGYSQDVSANSDVVSATNYTLHVGQTTYNPDNIERVTNYEIRLTFSPLSGTGITCGYGADSLDISNITGMSGDLAGEMVNCGYNDEMGWMDFGPKVVVNEFVADAQSDWSSNNYNGTAGGGTVNADDDFIELRVGSSDPLNLTNWVINVYNEDHSQRTIECVLNATPGCDNGALEEFSTVKYVSTSGGTITSTEPGDFIILAQPSGAVDLGPNTYIEVFNGNAQYVEDDAAFGTFNDGFTDDNAPASGSTAQTEASGLDSDGTSMWSASERFHQQTATPGLANTYESAMDVMSVYTMGSDRIGIDFTKEPDSAAVITSNFSIQNSSGGNAPIMNVVKYGMYVELVTEFPLEGTEVYTITISANLTGGEAITRELFAQGANDLEAPSCSSAEVMGPNEIELFCWDENGLDASGVTATVTPSRTVSNTYAYWDRMVIELSEPLESGTTYGLSIEGLKDNAPSAQNSASTMNFSVKYDQTVGATNEPLYVMSTSPSNDEYSVPTNIAKVAVQFNKPMDPATLDESGQTAKISLKEFDWATYDTTGSAITLDASSYESETNTWAITLGGGTLKTDTTYEVEVVGGDDGVKDIYGQTMPTYSYKFTTAVVADSTKPTVTETGLDQYDDESTSGILDPIDVPVIKNTIRVYFSEAMDPTSINSSDLEGNFQLYTNRSGSTYYVAGQVYYDSPGRAAVLSLDEPLDPYTNYTLVVTTNTKDLAGNVLASRATRSFTTGASDTAAPLIDYVDCTLESCLVKWSKPMGASAAVKSNYTITADSVAVDLSSASGAWDDGNNSYEIMGISLSSSATVMLTASGIKDAQGVDMSGSGTPIQANVFNDNFFSSQPFWIEAVYPEWGIFDIPLDTAILIKFESDDGMDESTITTDNITVKPITGYSSGGYPTTGDAISGTITYLNDLGIAKFVPASNLTANTEYEVQISSGLKDANGNGLTWEEYRGFVTGGSTDGAAPSISNVDPANGATDVSVGTFEVLVRGSESLDPQTITPQNVKLIRDGGSNVSTTLEYNVWDKSISIVPSQALDANTQYTVSVGTGVKDLSGNALSPAFSSTFTTGDADNTAPTVINGWSDGWAVGTQFSEHIQESSISLADWILICDGKSKTISDKNVWYDSWSQEVMIDGLSLTSGASCTITVSKVKDMSNNVIGSTNNSASFTVMDVSGMHESNWVMYSYPGPGDWSFPPNSTMLEIGFEHPVNTSTVSNSTVKLYPVSANGTDGTQVDFSSFDNSADNRTIYPNLASALTSGQEYHLVVTTGITDENGNNLMAWDPWNPTAEVSYETYFQTDSSNDTSKPELWGTSLDQYEDNSGNIVNVPQYVPIRIQFSKKMDSSTITDNDMSNANSNIQIKDNGGNPLQGTVSYLPDEKAAIVSLASVLDAGGNYSLVIGTGVKDLLNNALESQKTYSFAVTGTADTAKPSVSWAECEEFECRIWFSEPVKTTQAENAKNYTLQSPANSSVNVSNKEVEYHAMENMVVIHDLQLGSDAFFLIQVDNVEDLAGNVIDTNEDTSGPPRSVDGNNNNANQYEGYVWSNYDYFEDVFDKSGIITGSADFVFDKFGMSMGGGGFHVEPQNKSTNQSTMWFVDFPVDQVVAENSYFQLTFPEGVDVSGVTKPADCSTNPGSGCSPVNGDINGPGTGTLSYTVDSYNTAARTVTLKLTGGATMANDFLTTDINGIKTPLTKKDFNTNGYTVSLTVLDSDRKKVAGPYTSDPFYVTGGGSGVVQGTITATGVDDGETMTFELGSPWSGVFSTTATFTSGSATYKFQNLQAGDYDMYLPYIISLNKSSAANDFMSPPGQHFYLDAGEAMTYDFALEDLSGSQDSSGNTLQTLTVNVTGGTEGKKGTVEAGNWQEWYKKDFTFDSSGEATVTFRVRTGQYNVNVWDYMPEFMFGPPPDPGFIPPAPKFSDVNGSKDGEESAVDTLAFSVVSPNRYIKATVQDENGNGVPNVDVHCYDPSSQFGGGNGSRTGANGITYIKISEGDYKCEAYLGIGDPQVNKVNVTSAHDSEANAATTTFTVKTAGLYKISGTVVNGSEVMTYSPVWCNKVDSSGDWLPEWADSSTDGKGKWSVLVSAGTWKCQSFIPGYGDTDPVQKTVSSTDVTGVTLSPPSDTVTITGTILVNGTAPSQGGGVFAERETGEHKFSGTQLEDDGTFTLRVKESNTDTYEVGVFIPGMGEQIIQTGVVASSNQSLGSTDVSSGGALATVTINVTDFDGSAYSSEEVFVEAENSSFGNWTQFEGSSGSLNLPPGDNYTVRVFTKELGELTAQTGISITGDATLTFAMSSNPVSISGTIVDASNEQGLSGAWVTIMDPTTGYKVDKQADSNGAYSIFVQPLTTYNISASKTGYLTSAASSVTVASANVTNNLVLTSEASGTTVSGSVTLGGTAANSNATVVATCNDGSQAVDAVDNNGAYSLSLPQSSTISCTLKAFADGYTTSAGNQQTVTPSSNQTGVNIAATATGSTIKPAKSVTVNPEQASRISDKDAGVSFSIPTGTLVSQQSSATVTTKKTGNAPKNTSDATIVGDPVQVNITDSNGKVDLSKPLTVVYDYSVDGITDAQAANMTMAYYNDSTGKWVDVSTTLDTTADTLTFPARTFTIYGPKTNADTVAPSAPTSLAATASSGQVVLDWADNSESDIDNYNVYRSTSASVTASTENQLNSSSVSVSTYTDSTVSNGTTYYYIVTAVDASGNESSISSEVTASPTATTTTTTTSSTAGGSTSTSVADDMTAFADDEEVDSTEEGTEEDTEETSGATEADEDTDDVETDLNGASAMDYDGHWAEDYIDTVLAMGIASGTSEDTFSPDGTITRAELTKMVVNAAGYEIAEEVEEAPFYDVSADAWYAPYIEVAKEEGLIEGYSSGYFLPNDEINRAEALKILITALDVDLVLDPTQGILGNFDLDENPFTDVETDAWYAEYVFYAYANDIVSGYGDGTFGPGNSMTRAEFTKVLVEAMDFEIQLLEKLSKSYTKA